MHVDDLEGTVSEALARSGFDVERRVVLEGATGRVYPQDFHVRGPEETMVEIHADGPADQETVGAFHDALRDVQADRGVLVSPAGVRPDVELPDAIDCWTVHELESILDRDLGDPVDPGADEPGSAVLDRVYNRTPRRDDDEETDEVDDRLEEALGSAEALIDTADGILASGPVTDPDKRQTLEGFSEMLESLDDDKEEAPPEFAREDAEPPTDTVFDQDPDDDMIVAGEEDPDTADDEDEAEPDVTPDALPAPTGDDDGAPDDDPPEPREDREGPDDDTGPGGDRVAEPAIDREQATNLVTGMVHGSMEATIEHRPCYLYDYRMKMEDETNGHRRTGRVWVDSETLTVQEVPDEIDLVPGDVDHPAQREDKARETVREALRDRNVRKTKVVHDDENVTLVEEEDVRPDAETIELTAAGVVGRPYWRVAGENGDVLLDGITGEVVEKHIDDPDTGDGDFMVA